MFSVLAGIIPLSLRNGGGALIPFAPFSASGGGGNCPSAPAAPSPMVLNN